MPSDYWENRFFYKISFIRYFNKISFIYLFYSIKCIFLSHLISNELSCLFILLFLLFLTGISKTFYGVPLFSFLFFYFLLSISFILNSFIFFYFIHLLFTFSFLLLLYFKGLLWSSILNSAQSLFNSNGCSFIR